MEVIKEVSCFRLSVFEDCIVKVFDMIRTMLGGFQGFAIAKVHQEIVGNERKIEKECGLPADHLV